MNWWLGFGLAVAAAYTWLIWDTATWRERNRKQHWTRPDLVEFPGRGPACAVTGS